MPIGLKGNTDGSGAVQIGGSDAITISTGLNTTFAGTVTATGGVLYPLTSGTAIAATSGTALDFTGIPSWAKRITVMFNQVSTSGSSLPIVQLGAGSVTTSGYSSAASTNGATSSNITTGLLVNGRGSAGSARIGNLIIVNISSNTWVMSGVTGANDAATPNYDTWSVYGSIALSGTLDRVRITTVNGTDTFDAGSINILYE
jgi:hypothetical protein